MSKRFTYFGSRASFASTKSVNFDGVDADLRFADDVFNSLSGGSVSFWLYIDSFSVGNSNLFGCTKNDINNYVIIGYTNVGNLFIASAVGGALKYVGVDATGNLSTGQYYHIVWTKTGTTHAFYVNGVARTLNFTTSTDKSVHFNTIAGTRRYTIGSLRRNTTVNFVNGYIDEFVISPTAWSQAQVTEAYNNGCPANIALHSDYANIITWLRMGEGDTYPTILDNKGGNNTTMINMVAGDITTTTPCP